MVEAQALFSHLVSIGHFANIGVLTSLKYHCRAKRSKVTELLVTRNETVNNVSVYIPISNACDWLGREVCIGCLLLQKGQEMIQHITL